MEWPPPSVVIRLYASIDGFNLAAAKVDCQTAKFNSLLIFPVSGGIKDQSIPVVKEIHQTNRESERERERGGRE